MQTFRPQIGPLQLANPVILAPMAGISNLPYRRMMKSFGAALVFTEMVSANGLIREGRKTRELLLSCPEEKPLGIQLFGADPLVLAHAAGLIKKDGALLDINLGCPVKKVIRSGAGSALLQEPLLVGRILKAVRAAYSGPLTIKIRSGWDNESVNYLEIGRIAENEGIDAVSLHPRTRSQGFGGCANWEQIGELKTILQIPVFGSGDIFSAADGLRMLKQTGCDGLMIGRGGYGNPWLIRDILGQLQNSPVMATTPAEKKQVALQHIEFSRKQFGEQKTVFEMRKHLCWYVRGISGASQFRSQLQQTETLVQLLNLTETFFDEAAS